MNWQAVEKWAIEELTRLLPIGGRAALGKMMVLTYLPQQGADGAAKWPGRGNWAPYSAVHEAVFSPDAVLYEWHPEMSQSGRDPDKEAPYISARGSSIAIGMGCARTIRTGGCRSG